MSNIFVCHHHGFERQIARMVLLAAVTTFAAYSQPGAAKRFEVASVKVVQRPTYQMALAGQLPPRGLTISGTRVELRQETLRSLASRAFPGVDVLFPPPSADVFDLIAKMPEHASDGDIPEMIRTLLVERFGLTYHDEEREQAVFALLEAEGGNKLRASPPDKGDGDSKQQTPPGKFAVAEEVDGRSTTVASDGAGGRYSRGGVNGLVHDFTAASGAHRTEYERISMQRLAAVLRGIVGKPVLDLTGLQGEFELAIEYTHSAVQDAKLAGKNNALNSSAAAFSARLQALDPEGQASNVTLFKSLQKIGLRVEERKAKLKVVVVDHIEKSPTEN